jgi:outer membrane protein assembly factor BamB
MQHYSIYRLRSSALMFSFLAMLLMSACSPSAILQAKTTIKQQIYIETSNYDPNNPYFPESPQVYAIDAASGAQTWHVQFSGPTITTPLIVGNTLYLETADIATNTASLYALATVNGQVVHRQTVSNNSYYQSLYATGDTLIGDLVTITTDPLSPAVAPPQIVGIRSSDLTQIWQVPIQDSDRTIMRVSGTTVFVELPNAGTGATTALAFDAKTGKSIWQRQLNLFGNNMVAVGNTLYFWSDGGAAYTNLLTALDAATGKQIWQISVSQSLDLITANADEVFVQTKSQLEAFHAKDGTLSWRGPLGSISGWLVSGNVVYGTSAESTPTISALDAQSGHVLWTTQAGNMGAIAAVGANAVFVRRETTSASGTFTSQIEAFRRSDGTSLWKYPVQQNINWLVAG